MRAMVQGSSAMWTYLIDAFSGPGGAFMYAITAIGALAVAIACERGFWLYLRWRVDIAPVLVSIDTGDRAAAQAAVGEGPLADVVRAGLAETDVELAWEAMSAASVEAEELVRARVGYLVSVGNLSTMLGLLGTVYGLMIAFSSLGDVSGGERALRLSEGISTAMSTTALGLLVGIFSLGCHAAFEARVRALLAEMDTAAGRIALRARRAIRSS
jgi:biopolymer transport protein ExbB/TolQ